ncbi:hypothetical protein CC80DRAFT_66986 [Byssothecium circinans]|uniref:Uncharacterized protein n=1 Tax=Byssothecium circinans TaxID=147558 RepID=A0A6A5TV80_9PLEO|nr:hypothetical protein CC80DRAFT_66986 [Byssothecium circinans]
MPFEGPCLFLGTGFILGFFTETQSRHLCHVTRVFTSHVCTGIAVLAQRPWSFLLYNTTSLEHLLSIHAQSRSHSHGLPKESNPLRISLLA